MAQKDENKSDENNTQAAANPKAKPRAKRGENSATASTSLAGIEDAFAKVRQHCIDKAPLEPTPSNAIVTRCAIMLAGEFLKSQK